MGQAAYVARLIAAAALITPVVSAAVTESAGRKSFVIWRTDNPPIIDGRFDPQEWSRAAVIDDFHQTDPVYGDAPSEATVVRVTYDDEFLYIVAVLSDSRPADIRASQMIQGRPFFSDDRFYVMLDSFNSKRNDYFFQVNPNGVRRDALRENNSRFIEEWSTIWYAESAIHENGWVAEMAIPFKSVSFDTESDTWGINFGRGLMRKQEFTLWSSHDRQDWPVYGGEVTGLRGMEQGLGLDIVPSLALSGRHDLVLDEHHGEFEPSLDIRYRLTPSLTAAVTLNTDFSTAEVDDQQIALDRFSLFFPEKRDFFLQDAGIFEFGNIDTNGRPFFSRRIGLSAGGQPIGLEAGAKLTGRVGHFNIGALVIRQEEHEGVEAKDLAVARGSMNVLDESSVGFVLTHGDPASNDSNSVAGVDFLYRNSDGPFGQILTGNFWAQKSDSEALRGDDLAWGALLSMPNDRYNAYLSTEEIQEHFNPALGFVNRTGIRRHTAGFRFRQRPDSGKWRTFNHRIDFSRTTDLGGNVLSQWTQVRPIAPYSHSGDFYTVDFERNREVVLEDFMLFGRLDVPAGDYEFNRVRAEVYTGQQRAVSAVFSVQDGGFFDGDRLQKYVEVQWRASARFSMAAMFEENDVNLPSGSFTSHLASLKADLAFNSKWSWSNLLQYNNTDDVFGLNSRLRYIPEAGQEMILVFNHHADVDVGNRLHGKRSDLNLKISYTFRY